jgi:hypothetical protein
MSTSSDSSPISSIASSDNVSLASEKKDAMEAMVMEEPLYYILNGLLETPSGKNLAACVEELTDEIRGVRSLLEVVARRLAASPQQ